MVLYKFDRQHSVLFFFKIRWIIQEYILQYWRGIMGYSRATYICYL